ncbi:hypothetical protein [Streptomyces broussonetiae]|uniref:hypothetical protein n=1 Tax=Streptomyces broussonetiae TaxID=2686304 RepID=UPI0018EED090|nr:hypothetical protein [Streptomyces broussonetiae]
MPAPRPKRFLQGRAGADGTHDLRARALSPTAGHALERERALPGGAVEIVYSCTGSRSALPDAPVSRT